LAAAAVARGTRTQAAAKTATTTARVMFFTSVIR
jgi:hypothetical protein